MKRYSYQVYLGGAKGRGYTVDDIRRHLPASEHTRRIIAGWTTETELYRELRRYTAARQMELWLWFPVFSEHTGQAYFRAQRNIATGRAFEGTVFDKDENFDFCCPSDEELPEKLAEIYDRYYADVGFDGIFLDRIRYPSLTAGLPALFGCACPECMDWFGKNGLPEREIRECFADIREKAGDAHCENPLGIRAYEDDRYSFADPVMEQLCFLKQKRITETVSRVVKRFRQRGLKIGMDLFAPFLAPFVGQDYRALGAMADLVKPMIYRLTDTPAGMEFELRAILTALGHREEEVNRRRTEFLHRLYLPGEAWEVRRLFCRELKVLDQMRSFGLWQSLVPGIEIHTIKEKPAVKEKDIRESVRILEEKGFSDRIACWDIMSVGPGPLEAFINGEECG